MSGMFPGPVMPQTDRTGIIHGLHPGVQMGWSTQPESCLTPVVGAREGPSQNGAPLCLLLVLSISQHVGVPIRRCPLHGAPLLPPPGQL